MPDYERVTLLQEICTNLGGTVEPGDDGIVIRLLRAIEVVTRP